MIMDPAPGLARARELDIDVHDFCPADAPKGRSVYLQGQLHPNESASLLVLQSLVRSLRDTPPDNRVRIVPNASPLGWVRYLLRGVRQEGTIDDALAKTLWELSCTFNVVIDVHTPEFGEQHLLRQAIGAAG